MTIALQSIPNYGGGQSLLASSVWGKKFQYHIFMYIFLIQDILKYKEYCFVPCE